MDEFDILDDDLGGGDGRDSLDEELEVRLAELHGGLLDALVDRQLDDWDTLLRALPDLLEVLLLEELLVDEELQEIT